jgi:hypothetical protein
LKAQKSILKSADSSLVAAEKSIAAIVRRRKQRHAGLRQVTRDDDDDTMARNLSERACITCPVCLQNIHGDQDIQDAHVDACLAGEHVRLREERQREEERRRDEELQIIIDDFDDPEGRGGYVGNVSGTGFHSRNQQEQDVEDEIDVDGDDEVVFGVAQFTEGDIIGTATPQPAGMEDTAELDENEAQALRDLVAIGKKQLPNHHTQEALSAKSMVMFQESDRLDLAIVNAREKGDRDALLVALDNKVKQLVSPVRPRYTFA